MKKKNFISDEQVKNLVANGKYDNRGYYVVDIPNQFYNPNEVWEGIQVDTEEQFQDFVEKVTEEVFHQNKVKYAEQKEDIFCSCEVNSADRRLVLTFTSLHIYNKFITYTFEVEIPDSLEGGKYLNLREWIKEMATALKEKYISDEYRTYVEWEILSNNNVKFEVVQSPFISGFEY